MRKQDVQTSSGQSNIKTYYEHQAHVLYVLLLFPGSDCTAGAPLHALS